MLRTANPPSRENPNALPLGPGDSMVAVDQVVVIRRNFGQDNRACQVRRKNGILIQATFTKVEPLSGRWQSLLAEYQIV